MTSNPLSPRPPKTGDHTDLQRRLDNHFLTCSAFAGAAAMLAASSAEATIVYSGTKDITVPYNNTGLSIDLDTGTFSTTEEIAGFDLNFYGTQAGVLAKLNFKGGTAALDGAAVSVTTTKSSSSSSSSTTTTTILQKLAAGAAISGDSKFAASGPLGTVSSSSSSSSHSGPFGTPGTGYLGFRFVSAANTTLYGWVQLSVGKALQTEVVDWAYEDSGAGIVAGQRQENVVHMSVSQPTAVAGGNPAKIKFIRKGDRTAPLTVNIKVRSGTAVSGVDYTALPTSVVIPAGKRSATLEIDAINAAGETGTRALAVKALAGVGYSVQSPKRISIVLQDSD